MIRKLIMTGILAIPFLLITYGSIAQVYTYEDMPQEVKDKMDINKSEGLSSWNEILFTFHVTVAGLEQEEHQVLLDRASGITEIISVNFKGNDLVIVECPGGTNFDRVKRIFSSLVSDISRVENKAALKRTIKK